MENEVCLRRLSGKPKVRRFATIDIETTQWVKPYAVGVYDGHEYRDFLGASCISDALDYVLTPRFAGLWIYAHNGGNFDFLFFIRQLIRRSTRQKYGVEIIPIGSSLVTVEVFERDIGQHLDGCDSKTCKGCLAKKTHEGPRLKWTFVDSFKLMTVGLDKLGETFGLGGKEKLNMSYDDLAKPENRAVMRKYLETDCVLLWRSVEKMQRTINGLGGQIGVTLPATALDLFRRKFQRVDISTNRHWRKCPEHGKAYKKGEARPADACGGCMHNFIREAYFGGRSEIFRMKFVPYDDVRQALLLDINSHYPACMLEGMPIGDAVEMEGLDEAAIYKNAKRFMGIVECDVDVPTDCYLPPLPVKVKTKGGEKLVFPVGRLSGTWDTAELTLLKKVGGKILRTRRSVWFECYPVFSSFVRTLYKYRDRTRPDWNAGMDWMTKILLNSAYGKFAMREERSKIVFAPASIDGLTPIDVESGLWLEDVNVSPSYIVPQLSVHVTAVARARLWEILWAILQKGGRIYYSDTDSVVCSGVTMPTGTELGALKHEATITRAEFVLPKLYLLETTEVSKKKKKEANIKVKAKGMGPGIRVTDVGEDEYGGQLSEDEFISLVRRGAPIERHRLTKLRESLRDLVKSRAEFPRVVSTTKQMRSQYDKRKVLDDYDTAPLVLNMH